MYSIFHSKIILIKNSDRLNQNHIVIEYSAKNKNKKSIKIVNLLLKIIKIYISLNAV